jgi:hypothetical protein
VLVPIALAILLTFVLTPPVTWIKRWIGRIPAVLAIVTLAFTVLGTSEVPRGTISRPIVVTSEQVAGFSGFTWLSPIVGPLGTAGLVLARL